MDEEKKQKHAEYMRNYTQANKDKINRRRRERQTVEQKQQAVIRARRWKENNPERFKEMQKQLFQKRYIHIGRPTGEKHLYWKGEDASYASVHHWIRRQKGKADNCTFCHEIKTKYEWANINHAVSRNLEDYIPLCVSCHRKYDHPKNR